MKRSHLVTLGLIGAGLFAPLSAPHAGPKQWALQGVLRDSGGRLQSMAVAVGVSLFDAEKAGNKVAGPYLFTNVPVQNGLFTVNVEDATLAGKLTTAQLWIELTVGNDTYPRVQAASQLFSLRAEVSDGLSTSCVGCVGSDMIDKLAGAKVNGPVATATSADGLRGAPVAPVQPTEGQVLRFAGGQWTPDALFGDKAVISPGPVLNAERKWSFSVSSASLDDPKSLVWKTDKKVTIPRRSLLTLTLNGHARGNGGIGCYLTVAIPEAADRGIPAAQRDCGKTSPSAYEGCFGMFLAQATSTWVPVGYTTYRVVPPGDYTFEIRAVTGGGTCDLNGSALEYVALPL